MATYSEADARALTDLLAHEWDPIGVYRGPAEHHAPPGEYDTYSAWMYRTLRSGGGKSELLRHMQDARAAMGLEGSSQHDVQTAELILEWWREVPDCGT